MEQSWVLLRGRHPIKWIVALVSLAVIVMVFVELWHPGTMASMIGSIANGVTRIISSMNNVVDALGQLVRNISDWLH